MPGGITPRALPGTDDMRDMLPMPGGPKPAYCAIYPPSITNSVPVMKDASSDARNSTP